MRCNRGNHPLQIPCQSGGLLFAAAKKLIDKYKAHDLHFPAPVESVPHKQDLKRIIDEIVEAKRQAGRVLWLNPIPESKWQYVRSIQTMASICPMISCSTLRELAAACRRLAQV